MIAETHTISVAVQHPYYSVGPAWVAYTGWPRPCLARSSPFLSVDKNGLFYACIMVSVRGTPCPTPHWKEPNNYDYHHTSPARVVHQRH